MGNCAKLCGNGMSPGKWPGGFSGQERYWNKMKITLEQLRDIEDRATLRILARRERYLFLCKVLGEDEYCKNINTFYHRDEKGDAVLTTGLNLFLPRLEILYECDRYINP